MKYILYIDYRASYKPMFSEYKPLEAKRGQQWPFSFDYFMKCCTIQSIKNPFSLYTLPIAKSCRPMLQYSHDENNNNKRQSRKGQEEAKK